MSESDRRPVPLVVTLAALTVVSGFVDAVSFLGLGHVFTANMTRNVLLLGFAAAGAPGFSSRRASAPSPPSSSGPWSGDACASGCVHQSAICSSSPW